jgi:hypothetical protein
MFKKSKEENREYWIKIINDWKVSKKKGLTFCKENNISSRSFYRWRSKLLNPNEQHLTATPSPFGYVGSNPTAPNLFMNN